ncbi:hypothetical protein VTN31DRAFT_6352 [Thermomyces dupontii]|uniref:uncharacterized protein n=1 Tax=Talaromyces thermophilus TaxID=28565 RepID=UPI0037440382
MELPKSSMVTSIQTQTYLERYEHIKAVEYSKDSLIEELLRRVTELEDAYQREKLDHEREKRFNRDVQLHEIELMEQLKRVKKIMDREPFIVVLLDGDGLIFKDEFLRNGEQGGKDAANQLWAALSQYISSNLPTVSSPKIITRIYANVKGLANACYSSGIIDDPSVLDDFVRGFNESRLLFDFVDVGAGKDRADDKIGENFKINLYNCHCHQIFLGCSHDNGYARLLEETLADIELIGRISLIEGVPFEQELESLKSSYRVAKFPELFRDSKITPGPIKPPSKKTGTAPVTPVSLQRTPTNTTTSSSSNTSWASVTGSNPGDVNLKQASKPASPSPPAAVERNKYGQRIDRLDFKNITKEDLARVKKLKLCNMHYLLGECTNANCHHDHDYKLSKHEKSVLQAVARMTPCRFGTGCDDVNCIYGHRCPQSEFGKKECQWGSNCRFDASQHGIDTTVVKVTRI